MVYLKRVKTLQVNTDFSNSRQNQSLNHLHSLIDLEVYFLTAINALKVTKIILEKGWRCLDCTVCEGCGKKHDEANTILCDDCDISYHMLSAPYLSDP